MTAARSLRRMLCMFMVAMMLGTIGALAIALTTSSQAHAFESKCITINKPDKKEYVVGEKAYVDYTVMDPYSDPDIQAFVYLRLYINGKLDGKEQLMGAVEKGSYSALNATTAMYLGQPAPYLTLSKAGTYKFQVVCKPYNLKTNKYDTSIKQSAYPTKTVTFKVVKSKVIKNKTAKFKVTKGGEEVAFVGPVNPKAKSITIPSQVKKGGCVYKVTSIANKACKGIKNLKTVVIGSNIESIGANAFKGINAKAKIKVPKASYAKYANMLTSKAGVKKSMKIVAR